MVAIHVPKIDELGEQLSVLIGREVVSADCGEPITFDASAQSAIYVTREDRLAAILRTDVRLAAHLGAALAMMPAASSELAIKDGDLGEELLDAYSEVVNIMAGLLCRDGYPHVRLASVNACDPSLREDFMSALSDPHTRLDLDIEIEGYGVGAMSLRTRRMEIK